MSNRPVIECIKRDEPLVGSADETVRAVVVRMAEACCSSILLCEGEELRGIFRDIYPAHAAHFHRLSEFD